MPMRILLWLLASIFIGVVLVAFAWRGKRLNCHPVCRQCRFDLSGVPGEPVTCPECGAGLKRPGSVRIGQRRKRPIALAVGAAAVLLPVASIAVAGFGGTRSVPDW